jgi:hypothetical protein
MINSLTRFLPLFALLSLCLSGCDRGSVVEVPVEGKSFNAAFPAEADGYEVVFTREKEGFVQANLKKAGVDLAILTVADLIENPEAKAKFQSATDKLGVFPVVASGATGTALLVADRFQVQVRSRADEIDEAARKAWLGNFNLELLSGLAGK